MSFQALVAAIIATHVALSLAVAGIAKVASPAMFSSRLAIDNLLGARHRKALVRLLPALEISVGLAVAAGSGVAAGIACALFLTFGAYQYIVQVQRPNAAARRCGCYGRWTHPEFRPSAEIAASLFNAVLAALVGVIETASPPGFHLRLATTGVITGVVIVIAIRQIAQPFLRDRLGAIPSAR
jgi:hypothetical protein